MNSATERISRGNCQTCDAAPGFARPEDFALEDLPGEDLLLGELRDDCGAAVAVWEEVAMASMPFASKQPVILTSSEGEYTLRQFKGKENQP
jgi:hypothetical protein